MVRKAQSTEIREREIENQEDNLQLSIQVAESKLQQRTNQLKAKEELASKLEEEKEQLEADLNEKDKLILQLE